MFRTMNTAQKEFALEAAQLAVGYPAKQGTRIVADKISFGLQAGDFAAIVGVNGIGKSTLLRTLGQVQSPLSGQISLTGRNLHSFKNRELAETVSLVLTEPLATKNLAVWELVQLGRQPYTNWIGKLEAADKEKIAEALAMVGLQDSHSKKCYELSDGQMQKVLIARALAQDTPLMLLDEPTTHLDLYHKVQILKLLQRISHEMKKTILFTTHEIGLAIQLCDRMLILDNQENPFGAPCELIEQKRFESLFPGDIISFDSQTGNFKIVS
ncbi:ABC transporter ATP-binding protein [Zeaxanthinibacter enoshimensis]|uniref:ABC transporter ATP-binding protein n=1 Tax=Zeaxanthinibacter enoshimensis TaxID=392009 RepID=UPI0035687CEB